MNLLGMGRSARIEWIEHTTDHLYPSDFWCEIFKGEHLSVDFYNTEAKLIVLGERDTNQPLYKWKKWSKVNRKVEFPSILLNLSGNYDWINCEFVDGRLIEVHFRQNPDFRYENSIAIPIWDETDEVNYEYRYIEDEDYLRKGFYID